MSAELYSYSVKNFCLNQYLFLCTDPLYLAEARRHVPNQYHPVAPNSWTNARAKVRRGPPDAIGNKQVNDDVHGNNGRNERAMPTNIKAKQQQGLIIAILYS